jgi:hypothetical protein
MPDDNFWHGTRAELRDLVDQLRPQDALEIVKKLVRTDSDQLASMLNGLIRGFVARRKDEQQRAKSAP